MGEQLGLNHPLQLRRAPKLRTEYEWEIAGSHDIIGTSSNSASMITLRGVLNVGEAFIGVWTVVGRAVEVFTHDENKRRTILRETNMDFSDFSDTSDSSDSEDSSDDFLLEGAAVCFSAAAAELEARETLYCRPRLIWSEHVQDLRRRQKFNRTYRMDEDHFERLLELLRPGLSADGVMSTIRTGKAPISEEVVLHCTLRYFACGSYLDIHDLAHIRAPSFYRCLHRGISVILGCSRLAIKLPTT